MLLSIARTFSRPILRTLSWKPFPARDFGTSIQGVRDFSPDEALAAIQHYHGDTPIEVHEWDSPRGRSIRNSEYRTVWEQQWQRFARQVREGRASSSDKVRARYEVGYEGTADQWDSWSGRRPTHLRVGESFLVRLNGNACVPVRAQKIAEIVRALGVTSVCEVGSGSGVNLFCLAASLPHVALTGFELSAAGTDASNRSKMAPLHETAFGRMCRIGAEAKPAIERVAISQGSAYAIPSADASFDLVYTVAALEQMAANWKRALSEIHRVTRRYAIFYEYVRDFSTISGYVRNLNVNYFRQSIASIEAQGFRCLAVFGNLPTSIVHGASMVIAEKA